MRKETKNAFCGEMGDMKPRGIVNVVKNVLPRSRRSEDNRSQKSSMLLLFVHVVVIVVAEKFEPAKVVISIRT
jgi:hypothetical protein